MMVTAELIKNEKFSNKSDEDLHKLILSQHKTRRYEISTIIVFVISCITTYIFQGTGYLHWHWIGLAIILIGLYKANNQRDWLYNDYKAGKSIAPKDRVNT